MKTVYINFFGQITEQSAIRFMAACTEVLRIDTPECLYFLFSSAGGHVDAGVTIYNYLRALPVKIVMHNNGSIDSIANVIFHAADSDDRHAAPHATFLFHGVGMELPGGMKINRSQIQELLSQISALENKIASIITSRCSLSADEVKALFLNGESKDTSFALAKGVIKSVGQPAIPKDAKSYSLNFT
jgi:ATP-dependent Clp protease, protease subunit